MTLLLTCAHVAMRLVGLVFFGLAAFVMWAEDRWGT